MKTPKYVMFKSSNGSLYSAMDLRGNKYHRAAGAWGCGFKRTDDGRILAQIPSVPHIDGVELVEITEAEWQKDNEGYV